MNNPVLMSAFTLFVSFWMMPSTGSGQQYVFGRADLSGSPAATELATGDFNGDGRLDIAVSEKFFNAGLVSVIIANPDGTFPNPGGNAVVNARPVGLAPFDLLAGDFNGDGKLDVAVANSGDNTVSILLGHGDGTFQPQVAYATGANPVAITKEDFNGDGKLDLAVAGRGDPSSVSVLLGNGNGTFQSYVDYSTIAYASAVTTTDVNGDGKPDLIAGSIDGLSILLGIGDGTFQPRTEIFVYDSASVVPGDFNHDGAAISPSWA